MAKFKYAFDDNKRYHTWNYYLRNTFGEKIFNAFIMWSFHLISDMSGSSSSLSGGTGIPGIILSTFKEMSALPIFKEIKVKYEDDDIGLSVFISKLFNESISFMLCDLIRLFFIEGLFI